MTTQTLLIIGLVIFVGVVVVVWQQRQGVVKRPSPISDDEIFLQMNKLMDGSPEEELEARAWFNSLGAENSKNDFGETVGLNHRQVSQINAEIGAGRKINAIKLYREFTDVGLKEAKEAIEAIMASQNPPSPRHQYQTGDVMAQIEQELRAKRKINAVKLYREAYKVGLKEAKDAVEVMERNLGM